MTPRNGNAPLIPYLRQSRAKEKTISIEEQRRIIANWAKQNGVKLAKEIVEQNISGSKSWRERELGQALEACQAGTAQGVIVAFQDRLSREHGLATAEPGLGGRPRVGIDRLSPQHGRHRVLGHKVRTYARELRHEWGIVEVSRNDEHIYVLEEDVQPGEWVLSFGYLDAQAGRP
jgi:Resolvase, N terminal domain